MNCPSLDTSGTRYTVSQFGGDSWVFGEWAGFLQEQGLGDLDSFVALSGEIVDNNRRSVVYRLELGADKRVFYLKVHTDYFRKNLRTLYKQVPVLYTELVNLMHYGRVGIDALEPVAWGYQPSAKGGMSFLLLEELDGFSSLFDWLSTPHDYSELQKMTKCCATMVAKMHNHGLAHVDLYTWHIFVKERGADYEVIPIDLERTKMKLNLPFASFFIRLKQWHDLAVLGLTTPWPQVSGPLRLRFYLTWIQSTHLTLMQKIQARLIIKMTLFFAKKRGKFRKYGSAGLLE